MAAKRQFRKKGQWYKNMIVTFVENFEDNNLNKDRAL